jgi:hypothetical protein
MKIIDGENLRLYREIPTHRDADILALVPEDLVDADGDVIFFDEDLALIDHILEELDL